MLFWNLNKVGPMVTVAINTFEGGPDWRNVDTPSNMLTVNFIENSKNQLQLKNG